MIPRRAFVALLLALPLVSACKDYKPSQRLPDYRYRLTVEVETPQGLKTGSSVIEVKTLESGTADLTSVGGSVYKQVRGEAVAVDLPGGKTLFALLRSETSADWAGWALMTGTPSRSAQGKAMAFADRHAAMLARKEAVTLPRTVADGPRKQASIPLLVTFTDLRDPKTVTRVAPDALEARFGKGIKLKRITVQVTDDAVTTGIEGRLGWLEEVGKQRGSLIPDPPALLKDTQPIQIVSPLDFSTELYK